MKVIKTMEVIGTIYYEILDLLQDQRSTRHIEDIKVAFSHYSSKMTSPIEFQRYKNTNLSKFVAHQDKKIEKTSIIQYD